MKRTNFSACERPNDFRSPAKGLKVQYHFRGLIYTAGLRPWLERSLAPLQALASISAAAVVIEQRRDQTPAFSAFVSLAVPGPDIHAEARDHTLEAAWLKVIAALRRQIEHRKARQGARPKGNVSFRAAGLRPARFAAVARA